MRSSGMIVLMGAARLRRRLADWLPFSLSLDLFVYLLGYLMVVYKIDTKCIPSETRICLSELCV